VKVAVRVLGAIGDARQRKHGVRLRSEVLDTPALRIAVGMPLTAGRSERQWATRRRFSAGGITGFLPGTVAGANGPAARRNRQARRASGPAR
jgi:hypothetical protein